MKNYSKICSLGLLSFLVFYSVSSSSRIIYSHDYQNSVQNSDEAFLRQSAILCLEELRASNLAVKQGGLRVKKTATHLILTLSKVSEELRILAKNKAINLPTTLPDGGLSPDGRVDSAPENLRDTARLRNNKGEAGNTGTSASAATASSDSKANKSLQNLKSLKGNVFDQAYTELLLGDREEALKLLESASLSSDPKIVNFSKKYLGLLQKTSIR